MSIEGEGKKWNLERAREVGIKNLDQAHEEGNMVAAEARSWASGDRGPEFIQYEDALASLDDLKGRILFHESELSQLKNNESPEYKKLSEQLSGEREILKRWREVANEHMDIPE